VLFALVAGEAKQQYEGEILNQLVNINFRDKQREGIKLSNILD